MQNKNIKRAWDIVQHSLGSIRGTEGRDGKEERGREGRGREGREGKGKTKPREQAGGGTDSSSGVASATRPRQAGSHQSLAFV